MKHRIHLITTTLILTVFWALAATHPAAAEAISASLPMQFEVYVCTQPESATPCWAFTESELSQRCPQCQSNKKRTIRCKKQIAIDKDSFAYMVGGSQLRAHQFADRAAKELYGIGLPTAENGAPLPTTDLYENHERYGWVEVEDSRFYNGAIAVWPGLAGVIVSTEDSIQILYPSHKRDGQLRIINIQYLRNGEEPKYLVPKAFIEGEIKKSAKEN